MKPKKKTKVSTAGPAVTCALCGTVIQSKHVHDFVWCACESIAIDGGSSYTRCTGNPDLFIWERVKITKGIKRNE